MTLKQEIEALAAELQVYITGERIDPLYRNEAERTILRTADRLTQIAAQMPSGSCECSCHNDPIRLCEECCDGPAAQTPAWQPIETAPKDDDVLLYSETDPSSLQMHWEGLKDVPEAVLEAAVTRAIQTRASFPAPAELRDDADVAAQRPVWREPEAEPLPEPVLLGMLPTGAPIVARSQPRAYACEACGDTGFEPAGERTVRKCGCWASNPVLVRRREAMRRYAEARSR